MFQAEGSVPDRVDLEYVNALDTDIERGCYHTFCVLDNGDCVIWGQKYVHGTPSLHVYHGNKEVKIILPLE